MGLCHEVVGIQQGVHLVEDAEVVSFAIFGHASVIAIFVCWIRVKQLFAYANVCCFVRRLVDRGTLAVASGVFCDFALGVLAIYFIPSVG